MLNLNDPKWKFFKGGYKIKYDASVRLQELENTDDENQINEILKEFWNELHHQGDVDLASYYSLPHLIRIGIKKKLKNWNIPALIAVIEIQRHRSNPPIPEEDREEYVKEIQKVIELVQINQGRKWDRTYSISALSAIAAVNGQIELAEVILELEDYDLA
ncbi:MAG: hypothetical protein R3B47_03870 [Bacteroidia bacterium]